MKNKHFDLTQGGIVQKLVTVAVPIIGTQLMQMAYNLTDMFWLGRVGDGQGAVAASGTVGMFMWLMMAPMMLARMGAEIGAGQAFGSKDEEKAKGYIQNSILIAFLLSIVFLVPSLLFYKELISIFNLVGKEVIRDAESYLQIVTLALPFFFMTGSVNAAFNASGNSRTPFFCNSLGLMVNMVLDPVLIFSCNMGVIGAAWATITAQTIVFFASLIALYCSKNRPFPSFSLRFKVDWFVWRRIFNWGLPIALESGLFTVLTTFTTQMQNLYGTSATAVSRVGSQIESLSWLLAGGFGAALTTFIAQNYGAKKPERVQKGLRISVGLMGGWEIVVTLIMIFVGKDLVLIFLPNLKELDIARGYMLILSMCQVTMGLESVYAAYFKGTGKTVPPAIVSIASNAFRVLLAFILEKTPLGLYGVFLGVSIGAVIRGIWITLWYYSVTRKQAKMMPTM